jgi:hypothetical protein
VIGLDTLLIILPADPDKQVQIVSDDPIDSCTDAPAHHAGLIDGPDKDSSAGVTSIAEETVARGPYKDLLEHVEGYVWYLEELTGVGDVKADVGNRESREVLSAQRDVFGLLGGKKLGQRAPSGSMYNCTYRPATKQNTLLPGFRARRCFAYCLCNQSHDIVRLVVCLC